jgi:hypothetical protein
MADATLEIKAVLQSPEGRLQNLTPLVNDWTNKLLTVEFTVW